MAARHSNGGHGTSVVCACSEGAAQKLSVKLAANTMKAAGHGDLCIAAKPACVHYVCIHMHQQELSTYCVHHEYSKMDLARTHMRIRQLVHSPETIDCDKDSALACRLP